MKRKHFLIAAMLICSANLFAEMQMVIQKLTEKEKTYLISQIGRLTFDSKKMYLWDKQGSLLGDTKYKNIQKVIFRDSDDNPTPNPDNLLNVSEEGLVRIFPNPTQDILIVEGTDQPAVRLFNMNGQLLQTVATQDNSATLQTNTLPTGIYVLQVGAELYKVIKN